MYSILAYYQFSKIERPHEEVALHHAFFAGRDATSRIYISEEGINGQMSAAQADAEAYMNWMHSRPEFKEMAFKVQTHHEQVFPRRTIKYRKQLVALDAEVDLSLKGDYLSPGEWSQMLKSDSLIIDVRNDYEGLVGHFEGAEQPSCDEFRHFPQYVRELKSRVDPAKPVMMYCTGGIRCELFSALMKQEGFEKVYQLEGGVLGYAQKMGSKGWLGKLFVFDDRLTVPLDDKETAVVGQCHHCQTAIEDYYNCANMDCNRLFLCCQGCLATFDGCCQNSCKTAPRVRPYHHQNAHKPFRKWYHYAKDKRDLWKLNDSPSNPPQT